MILIGTDDGLHELEGDTYLHGHAVTWIARQDSGWWAILDGTTIVQLGDEQSAAYEWVHRPTCVLPSSRGVLVGGPEAQLWLNGEPVASFQEVPGRGSWYTPWGGPPDTRSIAESPDGTLHVNVHVGGIPRSRDGGATWEPTIDVDTDVHQVLAHPIEPSTVLAPCAYGLAVSRDGGGSYDVVADGLHAKYSRAVAVAGDAVLFTVSRSHAGQQAAVYRMSLTGAKPEKCERGLPEFFGDNIDTGCLAADGDTAAFGTTDGDVYVSEDAGLTWERAAGGLSTVRAVAIG